MKATEILMQEHRVIERVLYALERATGRLSRGEDVYLRFFIGTAVFLRDFTNSYHHKKEEGALLPVLIENGYAKNADPIATVLVEHEEGRRLAQKMKQATERLQAGDIRARDLVVQYGAEYVRLLRQNIEREDKILFPLADKVISADQQEQISKAFLFFQPENRGEDFHEKYYGLANRLVQECVR